MKNRQLDKELCISLKDVNMHIAHEETSGRLM